ncbi:MAG: hypothetical protein JSV03_01110 [Planctomycetota bacterium]|nr:MAG: hypothetical protein JSV03_01110 [Planctomycetota bacterium]
MSEQDKADQSSKEEKPKSIWDNDLPAGDSPPLPRWPLTASIIAYSVWIVFLFAMMLVRLSNPS